MGVRHGLAVHVYAIGGALAVGLVGFRMLPGAVASLASGGGENPRRCARVLHANTRTASVQAVERATMQRMGADGVLAAVGR